MAKSLLFERVGKTLVLVHNQHPVDDAEWDAYLEEVRRGGITGIVVWAPGAAPNASQRTRARTAIESLGGLVPSALFTESALVRGVVRVFSIFWGDQLKMFAPEDVDGAFKHAHVEPAQRDVVLGAISRLKAQLGG